MDVCGFEFDRVLQYQQPKYSVGLEHLCAKGLVNVEKIYKGVLRIKHIFDDLLST